MVRGRKPKRQELKEVDGSWSTHPGREREIVPVRDGIPEPSILVQSDELSLELWNETCELLQSMRFICKEDKPLIEAYCVNYSLYLRCTQNIIKEGDIYVSSDGNVKSNGYATNVARYAALHLKYMSELGLTPSARARLASPKDRSAEEDNPVGDLLKKLGAK